MTICAALSDGSKVSQLQHIVERLTFPLADEPLASAIVMELCLRGRAAAECPLKPPTLHVYPRLLPDDICANSILAVVQICSLNGRLARTPAFQLRDDEQLLCNDEQLPALGRSYRGRIYSDISMTVFSHMSN